MASSLPSNADQALQEFKIGLPGSQEGAPSKLPLYQVLRFAVDSQDTVYFTLYRSFIYRWTAGEGTAGTLTKGAKLGGTTFSNISDILIDYIDESLATKILGKSSSSAAQGSLQSARECMWILDNGKSLIRLYDLESSSLTIAAGGGDSGKDEVSADGTACYNQVSGRPKASFLKPRFMARLARPALVIMEHPGLQNFKLRLFDFSTGEVTTIRDLTSARKPAPSIFPMSLHDINPSHKDFQRSDEIIYVSGTPDFAWNLEQAKEAKLTFAHAFVPSSPEAQVLLGVSASRVGKLFKIAHGTPLEEASLPAGGKGPIAFLRSSDLILQPKAGSDDTILLMRPKWTRSALEGSPALDVSLDARHLAPTPVSAVTAPIAAPLASIPAPVGASASSASASCDWPADASPKVENKVAISTAQPLPSQPSTPPSPTYWADGESSDAKAVFEAEGMQRFLNKFLVPGKDLSEMIENYCTQYNVPDGVRALMHDIRINSNIIRHADHSKRFKPLPYSAWHLRDYQLYAYPANGQPGGSVPSTPPRALATSSGASSTTPNPTKPPKEAPKKNAGYASNLPHALPDAVHVAQKDADGHAGNAKSGAAKGGPKAPPKSAPKKRPAKQSGGAAAPKASAKPPSKK